ncbi:ATP-binding protein [Streptomyces sp. 4N509B]|uniref:ATP-binding protein n=1 Tax=Streptomyces sp. 4N509B TaxID=3457413 RepID=UPI003FCF1EEF
MTDTRTTAATPAATPSPLALPTPSPTAPGAPTGTWRLTVVPLDLAVPRTRHAVRELLRRQRAPLAADRLHEALLILTELLTNAVRHAALLTPEIGVEISLDAGWLRLAVEDGHPYRPAALAAAPEEHQTGGRGLLLVRTLALAAGGDCGVTPTATGGKTVWAALPLDPDA